MFLPIKDKTSLTKSIHKGFKLEYIWLVLEVILMIFIWIFKMGFHMKISLIIILDFLSINFGLNLSLHKNSLSQGKIICFKKVCQCPLLLLVLSLQYKKCDA